ncbi:hypothetical protein F5B22DRAFT_361154 [Xylaria bambusicola]|uniref:uncharacterized protein n=1 Tax=Xylaria bambusicola TaxID=326684 RepID=UPI0020078885|nr:uncharacterized protein F5B22DRAFT_361154 [Xylaria bambusicola]KAI0509339.1 hypothetical protein F5B22DRAFT_361154 [Xylaria bambusicola]
MRAISLPKVNSPPQDPNVISSDIPSPLHIIKRTKTVEFRPTEKRETSSGSIDYGPDRPLSVMKKRQCREPAAEFTFNVGDQTTKPDSIASTQRELRSRAPLRWLSRRTSSSGTTCRRYDPRSYSGSSDGSSNRGYIDEASSSSSSSVEPFESRCSTQTDIAFPSMLAPPEYTDDCHLLVPFILITPEVITSNNGISTVWVAIEISCRISLPLTSDKLAPQSNTSNLLSNPLRVGSVSRFGTIYNLQTDVIPLPQTAIVRVIKDNQKKSLSLGSSTLILAKIRTDQRRRQPDGDIIRKSNELIANIENELGAASIAYVRVRLRYNHSGFHTMNQSAQTHGTTDWQTQLETTVTGIIKRQALSVPSRSSFFNESKSPLFRLVASYWGPLRAREIFSHSSSSQTKSPVIPSNAQLSGQQNSTIAKSCFALQRAMKPNPTTPLLRKQPGSQVSPSDHEEDPARKIWTEMRRKTSRSKTTQIGNANETTTKEAPPFLGRASIYTGSLRLKSDVDRRRQMIRDVALRNKRSIGADSLKSLVPSLMNLDIGGKEAWGDSSSTTSNKENVPPERRKEGRWSIAGWW